MRANPTWPYQLLSVLIAAAGLALSSQPAELVVPVICLLILQACLFYAPLAFVRATGVSLTVGKIAVLFGAASAGYALGASGVFIYGFGAMAGLFAAASRARARQAEEGSGPGALLVAIGAPLFCVLLLAILIVSSVWIGVYLSPNFEKRLFFGYASDDSSSHINYALMLLRYGKMSAGLHGTSPISYHMGSHLVFGSLAKGLGITPSLFYNFGYPIVIIPQMLAEFQALAAKFSPPTGRSAEVDDSIRFGVLTVLLVQVVSYEHILQKAALWSTYFVSESYCFGLWLFALLLGLLVEYRNTPRGDSGGGRLVGVLLVPALLFYVTFAKVSVGFVACAVLGVLYLEDLWARRWKRNLPQFLLSALLGLAAAKLFSKSAPVPFEPLFFIKRYCDGKWLLFLIFHFFHHWLFNLSVLGFVVAGRADLFHPWVRRFLLFSWIALLLTLPTVNWQVGGGSGYYFTNVVMWISLAGLIALFAQISLRGRGRIVALAVALLCAVPLKRNTGYYMGTIRGWILPTIHNLEPAGSPEAIGIYRAYWTALHKIRETVPADVLVYVPASEPYWSVPLPRMDPEARALLIFNQSWHPAIYGFPYTPEFLHGESATFWLGGLSPMPPASPTSADVCHEVRRYGFSGYAELRFQPATGDAGFHIVPCGS